MLKKCISRLATQPRKVLNPGGFYSHLDTYLQTTRTPLADLIKKYDGESLNTCCTLIIAPQTCAAYLI
jgi:hypothetical protein